MNQYLQLAICLLVAAGLQYYTVQCHISMTYDSFHYAAAARSFASTSQLLDAKGNAYTAWSPLFPVLLSAFPEQVVQWGAWIQALALGGIIGFVFQLSAKLIRSPVLRFVCVLSMAFATPLLLVSTFLWSEPVFILLLLWLVRLLDLQARSKNQDFLSQLNPLLIVLVSNLLCMQRNVGIFFVAGAAVFLLGVEMRRGFRWSVFIKPFVYMILSSLMFLLWLWRNEQLQQGMHSTSAYFAVSSFGEELFYYVNTFTRWFLPDVLPLWFRCVLVFGGIGSLYFLYHRKARQQPNPAAPLLLLLSLLAGVYLLIMILLRKDVHEDSERYLAVIYPPVMLLLWSGVDFITSGFQKFSKTIIIAVVLLWMLYPLARTVKNVQFWQENNCLRTAATIPNLHI